MEDLITTTDLIVLAVSIVTTGVLLAGLWWISRPRQRLQATCRRCNALLNRVTLLEAEVTVLQASLERARERPCGQRVAGQRCGMPAGHGGPCR